PRDGERDGRPLRPGGIHPSRRWLSDKKRDRFVFAQIAPCPILFQGLPKIKLVAPFAGHRPAALPLAQQILVNRADRIPPETVRESLLQMIELKVPRTAVVRSVQERAVISMFVCHGRFRSIAADNIEHRQGKEWGMNGGR